MRLIIQIHCEGSKGYINEHRDFYFISPPNNTSSIVVHNEIAKYIEHLINNKENDKIVLKKFERD